MTKIRVFFILALLLSSSFFLQVVRCQSESDSEADSELVAETVEEGNLGIVDDDVQDFGGGNFSPAPGVETVCVFPKNPSKVVVAGQETELLIGMKNEGDQSVKVLAVHASVHLPFDNQMLVQNLSAVAFNNASVPTSVQATFLYTFAVSKFLQPGTFDLVGTIVYEIDQSPYKSTFYNGTIEVTEAGGLVSVETVFLVSLGISLLVFFGLWVRGQIQNLSKGKSTSDAIFFLRMLTERYRAAKKDLHMVFIDLEKTYDMVPRDVLWRVLEKRGVHMRYIKVIQDMYDGIVARVRSARGHSEEFSITVGLHQENQEGTKGGNRDSDC